jgi:hypothetical protein
MFFCISLYYCFTFQLPKLTIPQLKAAASANNIRLTATRKAEIVDEIMNFYSAS